jgi:hypothetical protein
MELPRTGIIDADCNVRINDLLSGENDVAISVDMSRRFSVRLWLAWQAVFREHKSKPRIYDVAMAASVLLTLLCRNCHSCVNGNRLVACYRPTRK